MKLTYGADPEVFIVNKATGNIHPICGLIGADKKKPRQLKGYPRGVLCAGG